MLLIETRVGISPIHGLGCFAAEPIERGRLVWVFDERIDLRIPVDDVPAFPESARRFIEIYGYMEMYAGRRVMILCGDHSKHMNHSTEPNLLDLENGYKNVAARDIAVGEELTCNYYDFDLAAQSKLGLA